MDSDRRLRILKEQTCLTTGHQRTKYGTFRQEQEALHVRRVTISVSVLRIVFGGEMCGN